MFIHKEETPLVFLIKEIDSELLDQLIEWFVRRKPVHLIRSLVNSERVSTDCCYELIFDHSRDAVEFKLTFL